MKYEVLQFLVQAQVAIRNGTGEIADIKNVEARVVQKDFNTNLKELASRIMKEIEGQQQEGAAPPPQSRQRKRAKARSKAE